MTREVRRLLRFVTSNDGSQCAADCPHRKVSMGDVLCSAFEEPLGHVDSVHSLTRGVSCLAFEQSTQAAASEVKEP